MFVDLFENSMPFFFLSFFNFSSKNPEEAELEDTLNQVVRRLALPTQVPPAVYLQVLRLFV